MAAIVSNLSSIKLRITKPNTRPGTRGINRVRCQVAVGESHRITVQNGGDSLEICRVLNGMWQTSGGWGRIDRDDAVEAMLGYADNGFTTFDMADHYGPAEDLYGIFINRVRRERPPEFLETVKGLTKWVPPPVKMTSSFVRQNIDVSRKRMDVAALDMLQFHWWDYSNPGYLDALKHLTDLKEEGKIKTVALTNFDTERLQIILENGIPVVSNQVQHSLVDMRPQQKMAELCQRTGVKLITYGTVMGGLLSEKFLDTNLSIPFAGPPLNTPSLQKYKRMVDAWGGWSLFQVLLRTLKQVATKHGVSIPTVAIKYILDQDYSNPGYLDALKHLTDLKEEGKIKTVALTNFDTERLQIILENGIPVVSNQVQHSLVDMRPQQKMAELCQRTGVKLITYGTVMGGLLSEKFLDTNLSIPFAGPPLNTPSLQKYKRMVDAWGGWSLFQVLLRTLKQVATKHGVSIPTVAIKYILDQPAVAGSMVGVRLGLSEHVKDTNAVFSLELDEEDVSSIKEVQDKGKDLLRVIGDCGDEYRR